EADGDVPEQPAKIPTEEENFAVPPEKPSITLTQQDIDKMILQDPAIQEGKLRIYAAFRERLGEASLLRVIQKEYQDFGGVLKLDNNTFLRHSNQKGIWIGDISGDYQTAFIPFNQIKKRIGQLIDADRYLNERELEEYNSIVPDKNAVNSLYDVRFVYKPGDIVHLNGNPYIISAISDETVTVYQEDSPLFTEKYIRERFEELMNGDAWDNRHLVVKGSARFEIYQLADTEQTREAMFLSLQALQNRGLTVERSNYEMVYSGELKRGETLDDIYQTFNIHHPSGFMGHSLTVSDVVVLTRAGESRAYYCDEVGFTEIPDFVVQEVMQEYILFDPEERSLSWIYFNPDGNQGDGQIVHNKLPVDEVADRIRVLSKEELQEYVNTHSLQHVYDIDSSDAFGEFERYVGSQRCGLRLVWNPQADDEEYVAFQERIKTFARASLAVNQ
ncbi:MAG: YodL domain-containing protein, partial [Ruminococcus sp.]